MGQLLCNEQSLAQMLRWIRKMLKASRVHCYLLHYRRRTLYNSQSWLTVDEMAKLFLKYKNKCWATSPGKATGS